MFSVIHVIETFFFSALWNPTYFRVGIPIYNKLYSYKGTASSPINEAILNEEFKKLYYSLPSLVFNSLTVPVENNTLSTSLWRFNGEIHRYWYASRSKQAHQKCQ